MTVITYSDIYFFDFETTGVNPKKDRPIQIGMAKGMTNPVTVMNELVNPQMEIEPGASAVHGITNKDLIGKPDFYHALCRMAEILHADVVQKGDGSVVVPILSGFNINRFDTPMADACLGTKYFSEYPRIDVLEVIYRCYPSLPSKKQVDLYEQFFGVPLTGAHGAIEDCYASAAILNYVLQIAGGTLGELVEDLRIPRAYPIMPIGKHKGKRLEDVPKSWAKWMLQNAKDMSPDLKLTVETIYRG